MFLKNLFYIRDVFKNFNYHKDIYFSSIKFSFIDSFRKLFLLRYKGVLYDRRKSRRFSEQRRKRQYKLFRLLYSQDCRIHFGSYDIIRFLLDYSLKNNLPEILDSISRKPRIRAILPEKYYGNIPMCNYILEISDYTLKDSTKTVMLKNWFYPSLSRLEVLKHFLR